MSSRLRVLCYECLGHVSVYGTYRMTICPKCSNILHLHSSGRVCRSCSYEQKYKMSTKHRASLKDVVTHIQGIDFKSWLCPAPHTKSFCVGFANTSYSSEGCSGDYTCLIPNQPNGAKGCPNDRGYKGQIGEAAGRFPIRHHFYTK